MVIIISDEYKFQISLWRSRVRSCITYSRDGDFECNTEFIFDGGRYLDLEQAIKHGQKLAEDGADFIDIGGESTRRVQNQFR